MSDDYYPQPRRGTPSGVRTVDGLQKRVWYGTATTSGGVATFYPTSDGTGAGTAWFNAIDFALATARTDTAAAIAVPSAAVKAIAANLKSVTVNVVIGVNLVGDGDTVAFAPDGTTVNLELVGT